MKFDMTLNLANLNTRREKSGEDDGPVACDLKLKGDVHADDCADLFSTKNSFSLLMGSLLDEDGELNTSDLSSIRLNREAEDCNIELVTEISKTKLSFETGDMDKITLTPKPGKQVEISMRLQVHPKPDQYGLLCEWLGRDLEVTVAKKQSELPLMQKSSKKIGAGATEAVTH